MCSSKALFIKLKITKCLKAFASFVVKISSYKVNKKRKPSQFIIIININLSY